MATQSRAASTETEGTFAYVQWGPILAGSLIAAAIAFVLHSFAGSLGVATTSFAPTWRDASIPLLMVAGLYLLLVALLSYGAGGYVAGRLRRTLPGATSDEIEFRDGGHGLVVWAIATILTGLLALAVAQSMSRLAAPGSSAGPATTVAGENLIAYELDQLFRAPKQPGETNIEYNRAQAGRILLTAAGHSGVSAEDRTYLAQLVSANTGLDASAAQQRVDAVIARARDNIRRARQSGIILGFMAASAALLGAAAAWFAAGVGGRHRDGEAPSSTWNWSGQRTKKARP